MFDVGVGLTVEKVDVFTSDQGGLSNEQIAEMATAKIVYVSDQAAEPIKIQANLFREYVKKIIFEHLELAKKEEKNNIYFLGRLANYKYFNMDAAIENALDFFNKKLFFSL